MKMKCCLQILLINLICIFLCTAIDAKAEKTNVVYAGFAFLGEHVDIAKDYKYSSKIYKEKNSNGIYLVEKKLRDIVLNLDCNSFNIISNQLGDIHEGDSIALAIALDWEDISTEEIEERLIKSVYNLHGQILLFNFAQMEIIGCYPFGVRVTDCTPQVPSETHKLKIFKKLYLESVADVNFLKVLSERLHAVKIDKNDENITFKVDDVVLEPKAKKFVKQNFPTQRDQAFKIFVAQQFSSFFAKNTNLSILPYTKGKAIGNKMAGQFANGDIFELQIPEGDYPITISVRGFKKAKLDENNTGESWAYGSYVRLNIKSALGDIVNSKIKNAAVKIVPAGQNDVADRSAFIESLLALFDKTTKQFVTCTKSWTRKNAEGDATREQFTTLKEKISKY